MFSRRPVLKALGGIAALTGTGLGYLAATDEGSKRSMIFWINVFPVFLHYRAIQFLNRDMKWMSDETADKLYNEAHEKYAGQMKDLTYRMRGFYLKQAQLMSIQDDFVPPAYMKWMKDTQDNVPSEFKEGEAKEYMRRLCKDELGVDFDEVFEEWDDAPLGVASIGQVHKAVLRGSHQTVAVKLLIPGMEPKFRADIRTSKAFCELAMPQHVTAFDEIEKQFLTEFDYRKEAEALEKCRNLTMPKWAQAGIVIPEPHMNLCSKHVLVMEFLDGVKLVDGIRTQYAKLAKRMGKSLEELETEMKKQLESGTFVFKTIEEEKKINARNRTMIAWNNWYQSTWRTLYNSSPAAWIFGAAGEAERIEAPIDLGYTLELLAHVQAANIFADGIFNGDAHPGNILLLKDGRIGLIDYGQVKTMSVEERIKYAKLIVAHYRHDKSEVVRIHFDEIGGETKKKDPHTAYLLSAFWNDRMTNDIMNGMNIAVFLDWLEAQDPMVRLPEQYLFAARSSVMLRGLGKAFGLNLRMSELWYDEATAFLKSQGVEY